MLIALVALHGYRYVARWLLSHDSNWMEEGIKSVGVEEEEKEEPYVV